MTGKRRGGALFDVKSPLNLGSSVWKTQQWSLIRCDAETRVDLDDNNNDSYNTNDNDSLSSRKKRKKNQKQKFYQ